MDEFIDFPDEWLEKYFEHAKTQYRLHRHTHKHTVRFDLVNDRKHWQSIKCNRCCFYFFSSNSFFLLFLLLSKYTQFISWNWHWLELMILIFLSFCSIFFFLRCRIAATIITTKIQNQFHFIFTFDLFAIFGIGKATNTQRRK